MGNIGRPKGSKNKTKEVKKIEEHICAKCGAAFRSRKKEFYRINSPLWVGNDNFLPVCRSCVDGIVDNYLRAFGGDLQEATRRCCMKFDIYYNPSIVESAKRGTSASSYMSRYIMAANLKPYTNKTFDTTLDEELEASRPQIIETSINSNGEPCKNGEEKVYIVSSDDNFEVTDIMITLFGAGYDKRTYRAMWEKYLFLKKSYPDLTNLHTEALVTYVRYKVKEESCVASGEVDEAKKWSELAMKAGDKAKINPSQLKQSDLQGGVNSFSELMMAVEQSVDVIPILPQFKHRPEDSPDFTIWCYVDYLRKLEGKPSCEYEDVYAFYKQRKKEYLEQYGDPYGIFEDDPSEKNYEQIKKFITLPSDYSEGE